MKATSNALIVFILLLVPLSQTYGRGEKYWAIRNTDLSKIGPKHAANFHKQMTKLIVKWDQKEKMPKYNGGSIFSFNRLLNGLEDVFIPVCHATAGETCSFGGWPSKRVGGSCKLPFKEGRGVASSMGTSEYDSNHYCNSKRQFRCNPLVFGPGIKQEYVGNTYPNINGRKNNTSPYRAGICLDISNGYSGLTKRCYDASIRLDEIRVSKGEKPWREDIFFNEENAKKYKPLQDFISDRCQNSKDRQSSDGMCDSLEKSIALTTSAALAGKLNDGIEVSQIIPKCFNEKDSFYLGDCKKENKNNLAGLYDAIEKIRTLKSCQFGRVNAVDATTNGIEVYQPKKCDVSVEGQLAESDLKVGQGIVVRLTDREGQYAGSIETKLKMGPNGLVLDKDSLYTALTQDGDNRKVIEEACKRSAKVSCNYPSKTGAAKAIAEEMEKLKDSKYGFWGRSCKFTNLEADLVDTIKSSYIEVGQKESESSEFCTTQFDSDLKDALESPEFKNKPVKMVVKIAKGGNVLNIPIEIDSTLTEGFANKIKEDKKFMDFCKSEKGKTAEEVSKETELAQKQDRELYEALGLDEKAYLTEDQRKALMKLKDIEGLKADVDNKGNITFKYEGSDYLLSVQSKISRAFGGLYGFERKSNTTIVVSPSLEDSIDVMANNANVSLTDEERSNLIRLERSDRRNGFISNITRNGEGHLTFIQKPTEDGKLREPLTNREIRDLESDFEDGMAIVPTDSTQTRGYVRSYTLRNPASVKTETGLPYKAERDLQAAQDQAIANIKKATYLSKEGSKFEVKLNRSTSDNKIISEYSFDVEGGTTVERNSSKRSYWSAITSAMRSNQECTVTPRLFRANTFKTVKVTCDKSN